MQKKTTACCMARWHLNGFLSHEMFSSLLWPKNAIHPDWFSLQFETKFRLHCWAKEWFPRVLHLDPAFSTETACLPSDPGTPYPGILPPRFPLTPCKPVFFFARKPVNSKKKKIKMLLAGLGSVGMGNNCDRVRIGKNCDLGHSFSPYGPVLSRPITYVYSNGKEKICKKHQSVLYWKKAFIIGPFFLQWNVSTLHV